MQYISQNLAVEIYDTDKTKLASIPVMDARNPIVSYELDQSRINISKIAKEYEIFSAQIASDTSISEQEKNLKIYEFSNKLRDANIDHLKLCIKDYDEHKSILKLVPSSEFSDLQSAIMRASFGIADTVEDEKKNLEEISLHTTRRNSARGATRKRK